MFSFNKLLAFKLKGFRNGNWRRLSYLDKALFNCALELAKIRGRIENMNLMVKIAKIMLKLKVTLKSEALKVGVAKALALKKLYALKGVFNWCPSLKDWLNELNYIFYLGLKEIFG
ncbi:MAG: hypothetical protein QXG49_03860 [Candidatus Bathyarchaeia archaeon]